MRNRPDMTIEEAIVYVLASSNCGMRTERIAAEINSRRLFARRDGKPVDGRTVYAVVMSRPDVFVRSEGLIRLLM